MVVTFIQQSWSNRKSIFLASFFTFLLFLIAYSSIIYYSMEHILLFIDPAPLSGSDIHPAELVQQQVHLSRLLLHLQYLLFLIAYSSIISYPMEHVLLFLDPSPLSGGYLHPAELVQQQVHLSPLLLHLPALPNSLLIYNFLFYGMYCITLHRSCTTQWW